MVGRTTLTNADVVKYYGEWIKDEVEAEEVISEVKALTRQWYNKSFSTKLRIIRDYLMEVRKITDIPFSSGYRRASNE